MSCVIYWIRRCRKCNEKLKPSVNYPNRLYCSVCAEYPAMEPKK